MSGKHGPALVLLQGPATGNPGAAQGDSGLGVNAGSLKVGRLGAVS